jgi:hypothetical protein
MGGEHAGLRIIAVRLLCEDLASIVRIGASSGTTVTTTGRCVTSSCQRLMLQGHKELIHPVVGPLSFNHAVFQHGDTGQLRLVLYTPTCAHDTPAKLAQLLDA